ncbi:MAG TPA: histidine ammonia-lyase [Chitinophagales bacterium]|nr:histidine ammonia-lyase [Chitinophagales bacterium]
MAEVFHYGTDQLTVRICMALTEGKITGVLSPAAKEKIVKSQHDVLEIVENDETVYGINTGFGILANKKISKADAELLQYKILQSHSVGIGNPIPKKIAKTMLITKLHALAQGFSGVQLTTLERILWMIDEDIIPLVPEKGSVGASGDLAPLAHLFLPLIGMGEVYYKEKITNTQAVLQEKNMEPVLLGPKEGLALINGTQFILSYAVHDVYRLHYCLEAADIAGAMSLEALQGSKRPFETKLHELRPYAGSLHVAKHLQSLLENSEIMEAHEDCERVQDPYSLRCMPQVHGASRNAWLHLKELTEIELNSVTDNPVIFSADDTISGGNFHGQPLALPLDYACFAASELGNIADRRCYLMLEGKFGLPMLLMNDVGLNSGFMIPQYTTAALVTENKTLCFPASADSIPTSLGQEDHVSMGSISGRKLYQILDNIETILAIELMCAAQAIEFRRPLKSSSILEAAHNFIRDKVSFANEDRIFANDIKVLKSCLEDFSFVDYISKKSSIEKEKISFQP